MACGIVWHRISFAALVRWLIPDGTYKADAVLGAMGLGLGMRYRFECDQGLIDARRESEATAGEYTGGGGRVAEIARAGIKT